MAMAGASNAINDLRKHLPCRAAARVRQGGARVRRRSDSEVSRGARSVLHL